ncbi:DUF3813 domain-containing protein [Ectobacillus sp. JY-23]|uniref:DUF3813 domain-containing protein n=1 Tax=Ectobacillus sp. JY-23 TaxID=2933872 RepID=UPI001FF119B4|nr:DUF3813 domain-containing protein [Ectobacillus sp. JY-23]UOY92126.1 DUF3813 domain-containing protein [Ectobacillus sp. JY-23]
MGNMLFQQARDAVTQAVQCIGAEQQQMVEKAKNALSSAYANSSTAEKTQLRDMQQQLQDLQ